MGILLLWDKGCLFRSEAASRHQRPSRSGTRTLRFIAAYPCAINVYDVAEQMHDDFNKGLVSADYQIFLTSYFILRAYHEGHASIGDL